ncbi:MAG: hypothetical protein ABUK01_18660 [Leptospirales bacterium]
MEYLAIGLLALGIIFILIGIVSGLNRQNGSESAQKSEPTPPVAAPAPVGPPLAQTPVAPIAPVAPPAPTITAQPPAPPEPKLSLHVSRENPVFFQKEAYMYLDYNHNNIYNGVQSSFKIMDTTGIRRFGMGEFSYNGFAFKFEYDNGIEEFSLETIEHVSVYPNCIAISFIAKNPVALFFVDSTKDIRSILDTFRINNAS